MESKQNNIGTTFNGVPDSINYVYCDDLNPARLNKKDSPQIVVIPIKNRTNRVLFKEALVMWLAFTSALFIKDAVETIGAEHFGAKTNEQKAAARIINQLIVIVIISFIFLLFIRDV